MLFKARLKAPRRNLRAWLGASEGLTLIEMLVVLVIIALVATLVAPRVLDYLSRAKSDTAKIQIQNLATVLDLYRLDVGNYPESDQGLKALVSAPTGVSNWFGPYIKDTQGLTDPWGRDYQYKSPGEHADYDLWTFGADGKEGGEGEDADLSNWQN